MKVEIKQNVQVRQLKELDAGDFFMIPGSDTVYLCLQNHRGTPIANCEESEFGKVMNADPTKVVVRYFPARPLELRAETE